MVILSIEEEEEVEEVGGKERVASGKQMGNPMEDLAEDMVKIII